MTKIYIVVDACSGEDFTADDPIVLHVDTDEERAKDFFDEEIKIWEDGLTDFDSTVKEHRSGTKLVYECTDFKGDSHRVMKLIEKELQ